MKPKIQIDVSDSKYTFIINEGDYKIIVLRYGEEWLTIEQGSNAIAALLYEIEELNRVISEIVRCID